MGYRLWVVAGAPFAAFELDSVEHLPYPGGVAGISMWRNSTRRWRASRMALMTAGGAPTAPASPAPLTPAGLAVEGIKKIREVVLATTWRENWRALWYGAGGRARSRSRAILPSRRDLIYVGGL